MRLKQIDLHGFKSFGDKVSIELSEGVTAIVGPNGSGKSNVSDAVRWVLGEQSARALRGTKMEDVIFNGAENRKPLSYCEVTLTFDNEDQFLHVPHSEVTVTRRVYRSGESEYLINQANCRMKDIHALFYDTGVGREGYSIIGQGRIEEILSPKGEERRAALEEAAGVMKYKVRREEAQRKLNNVDNDMLRVGDILSEIEHSLEPLRQQSEEAAHYLALREELKDLEINLFLTQYDRNREKNVGLQRNIAELEAIEAERKTHQQELKGQEELHREKLMLMEQLLEKAREKALQLSTQQQKVTGEAELLAQRMTFLKEESRRLQEQEEADALRYAEIQTALAQRGEISQETLAQLALHADALDVQAQQASERVYAMEEKLDVLKQKLMDRMGHEGERKARVARLETLRAQAGERRKEILARQETAAVDVQNVQEEVRQVQQEYTQAQTMLTALQGDEHVLQQQEQDASRVLQQALQQAQNAQAQARDAEHTLTIQKQLARDFEGYANSVRRLMKDVQTGQMDHTGILGTVGTLVRVPREYEKAMEQALGGGLQNVVVQDEQVGKKLIQYLRQRDYGRVTFLPLSTLRARTFSVQEKQQIHGPGVLGCAVDLIGFDPSVRKAMDYLLGRTLVVEDMDAGLAVTRKCPFSFRCVTLAGDILQSSGAMTGGSARERGLVSRERMVEEAAQKAEQARQAAKQAVACWEEAQQAHQQLQAKLTDVQKQLYEKQAELRALQERLDATVYAYEKAQAQQQQLAAEAARVTEMLQTAERDLHAGESDETVDEQTLKANIALYTQELHTLRQEQKECLEQAQVAQMELAARTSEQSALQGDRQRLERELLRLEQGKQTRMASRLRNEQQAEQDVAKQATMVEQLRAMEEEIGRNQAALQKLEMEKESLQTKVRSCSFEQEQAAQLIAESTERRYRLSAQVERLDAEFENIQNKLWDNYQLTYAQAEPMRKPVPLQKTVQQVEQIHTELREMDYINPGAIEEYKRVKERFDFLTAQKEDLGKARQDLQTLIVDLTEEMQKRFLEQFAVINENFGRIFVQLFGGGHAEMRLQDESNAMECGIDIIAQPPGKKLQQITLLSGGERALTAIAILFSLLELKATPFCILDEIEAALDEENLRLLADFLRSYSKRTQFIVITHRRPTMEAAQAMYGIAMEEKGVSKLVSVKFHEKEREHAGA